MKKNYVKDLVSVIIPVYNCEKYIEKAINSILEQTYKKIEIVICNDCSSDDSDKVIKKICKKYDNILYLQNKQNMKISYTKNKCLKYCKGQFIASQDADDYSDISKLEKQVAFLKNNLEYDYVSCGYINIDENDVQLSKTIYKKKAITDNDFVKGTPVPHACTMFRKNILEKVNGYRVSKETKILEDYDLFFRLNEIGVKGYLLDENLYYYRIDSNFYNRRKYRDRYYEYLIRKKYFGGLKIPFYKKVYIYKPLLVGLIPKTIYKIIKKENKK